MKFLLILILALTLTGCGDTASQKDSENVEHQQNQYVIGQPVPNFNWSLERDLVIKLYSVRNQTATTHSVWRSNYGTIEGDCPSYGFGIPYDTSLTNPLKVNHEYSRSTVTEQVEPNGIFASKNTAATWVMCLGITGQVEPVYVETKVTVYPGEVSVNYENNRVTPLGKSNITIDIGGSS